MSNLKVCKFLYCALSWQYVSIIFKPNIHVERILVKISKQNISIVYRNKLKINI